MILRNSILNLIGLGIPLGVGLVTIPQLIEVLGTDRFGLLTLMWAIVSYFGLFDLGLGRALTLQMSRYFAMGLRSRCRELIWTALLVMCSLGVLMGVLLYYGGSSGLRYVTTSVATPELAGALFYMALTLPFILATTAYRGALEAIGAFQAINLIRIPMGLVTFAGPLFAALYWSIDLAKVSLVLCVGRILGCIAHLVVVHLTLRELNTWPVYRVVEAVPLFKIGGWLSVSNIVSPLMGYVDRFLIGSLLSATAVAYYATPNEMITKLWILPGALTAVLFPHFASLFVRNQDDVKMVFEKSVYLLYLLLLPITLFLFSYSHLLFDIWISKEFADESYLVFKLFCLGILVNCIAHVPYTLIQSTGNTKITALIHLFELPFFMALLFLLIESYGIIGAAIAWVSRMMVDALLMFWYSKSLLGGSSKAYFIGAFSIIGVTGLLFSLSSVFSPRMNAILLVAVACMCVIVFVKGYRAIRDTGLHLGKEGGKG